MAESPTEPSASDVPVVILCGGMGTRLSEEVDRLSQHHERHRRAEYIQKRKILTTVGPLESGVIQRRKESQL